LGGSAHAKFEILEANGDEFMKRTSRFVALALIYIAAPLSLWAHHSSAMYDEHKSITVKGIVKRFEWSNPHVYLYVEQAGAGGAQLWEVECSPPSILKRLGWTQDSVHLGDVIEISGSPSRKPDKLSVLPNKITVASKVLFDRKGELAQLQNVDTTAAALSGRNFDGVWLTMLDLKVGDLLEGGKAPLNAKGKKAAHAYTDEKMHPGANCVAFPAPVSMSTPDLKRITTRGDRIIIEGEFDGAVRTVELNKNSHQGAEPSVQGHSIGHWDGDALVIDTTEFSDHAHGVAYGVPSDIHKHLIEKLSLDPSGKKLTYHFEMTDPDVLTGPMVGDLQWVYRPDLTYAPLKCDPENASRFRR
jgi:hypothetical protein